MFFVYSHGDRGAGMEIPLFLSERNGTGSKWCGAVKVI
jgi:hypothetical protein